MIHFELPGLPKMVNANSGRNWRAIHAERKKWKQAVGRSVRRFKPKTPWSKASLKLVRYSSSAPDYDGLVSGFKPIIDGLVEHGVLADDSLDNIGMPEFQWIKIGRGAGKIEVFAEPLDNEFDFMKNHEDD